MYHANICEFISIIANNQTSSGTVCIDDIKIIHTLVYYIVCFAENQISFALPRSAIIITMFFFSPRIARWLYSHVLALTANVVANRSCTISNESKSRNGIIVQFYNAADLLLMRSNQSNNVSITAIETSISRYDQLFAVWIVAICEILW